MEIPVYNMAGEQTARIAVDEDALGGTPNRDLIRQAVLMYEANRRVGTAATKTRAMVSGSGRKLWRQKGTGRARQATRKSPISRGGGTAHGPRRRDYRQKMNKAMRRRATASAFLAKALDAEVMAVEGIELSEMKTRCVAEMLKKLGVRRSFLIVLPEHDADLWRCARNIPGAAMATYGDVNAYQLIRAQRVVFTREAIEGFLHRAGEAAGRSKAEALRNG